jgi:hypothetical protein
MGVIAGGQEAEIFVVLSGVHGLKGKLEGVMNISVLERDGRLCMNIDGINICKVLKERSVVIQKWAYIHFYV